MTQKRRARNAGTRRRRAAATAGVVLLIAGTGAGLVHFGRVISGGLEQIVDIAPAGEAPQPETQAPEAVGQVDGTMSTGGQAEPVPAAVAEVESDLEAAVGLSVILPQDIRDELARLTPIETPDELLVIEPGVPSNVYVPTGAASLSAHERRLQAAQSGSEDAIREIIAGLGSDDPSASRDARSALRRLARTGDRARFEAVLAEAEPGLRERVSRLLATVAYD